MSTKTDLLKQIEKKVTQKKKLSKELSREKTVMSLAMDFFEELKRLRDWPSFVPLTLHLLNSRLSQIDSGVCVVLEEPKDAEPRIIINWSSKYVDKHNCEAVTVVDESSAYLQTLFDKED